jgi:hypothetical protein
MVNLIRKEIKKLEEDCRRKFEATRRSKVTLEPQSRICPECHGRMVVQKTHLTYPITIEYGMFIARVVTYWCKFGCRDSNGRMIIRQPEILKRLVPKGANYGYDVEVFIGIERFVHHRQRQEIQTSLLEKGVPISEREVSVLAKRFVLHLGSLHNMRSKELKAAFMADGGYPLHIDATGENGCGTILVGYAGWRKWILGCWKLTTECAEQIKPKLHEIADLFGMPCAIIRDLGRAMIPATKEFVQECGEDTPILACHAHFLKDIGKDLLDTGYDQLRRLLRHYAIRSSLRTVVRQWSRKLSKNLVSLKDPVRNWSKQKPLSIPKGEAGLATVRAMAQWVLDYQAESNHLRFPFELPYAEFYKRCKTIRHACNIYLKEADKKAERWLKSIARITNPVLSDPEFERIHQVIKYRWGLFCELRDALRIDPISSHDSRQDMSIADIHDVKEAVEGFTRSLEERYPKKGSPYDKRQAIDIILDHLRRHQDYLWGHVILLPEYVGGGFKMVDRTNNNLEGLFGGIKNGERRRSGRKVLSKDFEDLPEGVAIVQNLKHDDYVEILCGSLENLAGAFAEIDYLKEIEGPSTAKVNHLETASLSNRDRKFIRSIGIQEKILQAASKQVCNVPAACGN